MSLGKRFLGIYNQVLKQEQSYKAVTILEDFFSVAGMQN